MRFVEISGFCIRQDRYSAFQKWMVDNEGRIKASYPEGSEYGGCYTAVFTSEKEAGDTFWLDIHDSYAALDRAAANAKDPSSDAAKLNVEMAEFLDPDRRLGWSKILLKSITDVTTLDLPRE